MSSNRDIQDQLPLTPHSFQILLSLLHQDLHGYGILKDVARRTGGEMTLGTSTLYATLQRLVRDGFLAESCEPDSLRPSGPPRKCFRLTESGRGLAREEGLRIRRLNGVIARSGLFDSLTPAVPGEDGP
jgi:DNA-binding PadR family transcriptional regulator